VAAESVRKILSVFVAAAAAAAEAAAANAAAVTALLDAPACGRETDECRLQESHDLGVNVLRLLPLS
jgi:hypothetical protein